MDPKGPEVSEVCFHKKIAENRTIQSIHRTENIIVNLITGHSKHDYLIDLLKRSLHNIRSKALTPSFFNNISSLLQTGMFAIYHNFSRQFIEVVL